MSLPSKVTPYRKSTISKFPILLAKIKHGAISPTDLFNQTQDHVGGYSEFIEILDELYALGCINLDSASGRIYYAL